MAYDTVGKFYKWPLWCQTQPLGCWADAWQSPAISCEAPLTAWTELMGLWTTTPPSRP